MKEKILERGGLFSGYIKLQSIYGFKSRKKQVGHAFFGAFLSCEPAA
jgi:hypothetical protein